MKKVLLTLISVGFLLIGKATVYYSTNNASPNVVSSWHTNRNGTGSLPSNFSGGNTFVIQAGHYMITSDAWNIAGADGTLIIETGATLKANDKVSAKNFEMYSNSFYIHNNETANIPGSNIITLSPTSTVEIKNWNGSSRLPDNALWGNLILDVDDSYNSNWNQAGKLTNIAGNFIVHSTGSSTKEFRLATNQDYTLTIGGDFIIDGGNIDAAQSNTNADQAIIIKGSFIQSGGTFTCSNSNVNAVFTIQFDGNNSSFNKTGGTFNSANINWKVNTNAKLIINNSLPVAVGESLSVNGELNFNQNQVTGLGSFTLATGGKVITYNTSGLNGALSLNGALNFSINGSYEFHGATTTPFPLLSGTISAFNVLIDADVTINKDLNISGTLTLNNGKLIIPPGNTVKITSGSSGISGSGFSNAKHIVTQVNSITGIKGMLRLNSSAGNILFPVGNGTYYLPVTLNASGTTDFSVCAFQGATKNGEPNGTAFTTTAKKQIVDAMWVVNKNSATGNINLQVGWPAALEGTTFSTYADNEIGISHYDGTAWDIAMGTGSQLGNTAIRSSVTSFSPFGVGKMGIPLPLKFGNIKASQKNDGVLVEWTSLSEFDVDHYEVERSNDGANYLTAGRMNATANNSAAVSYSWLDRAAISGAVFYRIKAIDIDGKYYYSPVVKISLGDVKKSINLYPNPVTAGYTVIQSADLPKGTYTAKIFNNNGQLVYQESFSHSGGAISESIRMPGLSRGMYHLKLGRDGAMVDVKSFIVQ